MQMDQSSARSPRRAGSRVLDDSEDSFTTLRVGPALGGLEGMAQILSPGSLSIANNISASGR
jgi:hypothetical protein